MNEIEKMYKNAGVKLRKVCTHVDCDCAEMLCDECEYFKDNIFAFTAEKQLELIKWLAKIGIKIDNKDGEFTFSIFGIISNFSPFEESLANLISNIWKDLTEEEKKQIKEILE